MLHHIHLWPHLFNVLVQENFSKTSRIQIFDLYPVVGHLFVRCFLMFFGGRFGRVSRGTLPILATIHAVLVELQRVLLLCGEISGLRSYNFSDLTPPYNSWWKNHTSKTPWWNSSLIGCCAMNSASVTTPLGISWLIVPLMMQHPLFLVEMVLLNHNHAIWNLKRTN